MTALDDLREALRIVQELGPILTRVDMGQESWDVISGATQRLAGIPVLAVSGMLPPALGVSVTIVDDLPPYAMRLHWSDGRTVTRYRIIRHPSLIQFTIGRGPASPWWPGRGQISYDGFAERWLRDYNSVIPRSDANGPQSVTPGDDTSPCG